MTSDRTYPALDPTFAAALRRELVAATRPAPRPRRRLGLLTAGAVAALSIGGVAAVAASPPADQVADPPLAAPVILNGVGPAVVALPPPPTTAAYVSIELTCFDGDRCNSPGGGVSGSRPDGPPYAVERSALPLVGAADPQNPQALPRLDPAAGVRVDVETGTHWRLYAVYTDGRDPRVAPLADGRTLGVPGVAPTDLVPAVATNGAAGWVEYAELTYGAPVRLTAEGTAQDPLPVYGADGVTVIGVAEVSQPYRG